MNPHYIDVAPVFWRRAGRREEMKLKKLELFGFKSFYDKTTFEFSDGITAIVGPNGCGKSNIVDAIRWVLGEHAPSYLRSKQLEDVIFAGSDAAGPLGMAEVSVTFSNEGGDGPPGYESFSEIQVTRRAFRDGESEFYVNRVPCRLKDIAEMFLDTGAGARGYAIIEQGRIMGIVNARPEEKRLIVEEAAGVAKYRARKREAERKMESARQNLARVRDVHDEVKRQLAGLERQVRKAERYKALRDELAALELAIAARRRLELSSRAARLAAERAALEAASATAKGELAAREAEVEARKIAVAEAESALSRLREEHFALKEWIARKEAEREGKVREAEDVRRRIDEADAEVAALAAEIAAREERIAAARAEASRRAEEIAALRERAAALAAEAEAARERCRQAEEMYARAQSDLMVRVTLHSNARSGVESLQKVLEENERTLSRLEERIAAAKEEVESLASEAAGAFALLEEGGQALQAASTEWEEDGVRLAAIQARAEAAGESRRRAEGDLSGARSRLVALRRMCGERDWASSGVKAVLRYYGVGKGPAEAPAPLGVMGELIETDPEYEKAVEAVLGERVQSIVVRDHSEGLSALRYLKETQGGRVSFVPISLRTHLDAAFYGEDEGVIAPLAELVRVPSGCEDLVRGLFGGTLLVRDIESAVRLWNRNGVWNSYVTLDGDLVTADGVLMGGAGEAEGPGVLSVRREVRELEREVEALAAAAERAKAEEEALRRERQEAEEKRKERFRAMERLAVSHAEAGRRHARLSEALSRALARAADLEREREHLLAERARIAAELGSTERAAKETEAAWGAEEERVRVLSAQVGEERRRLEEAQGACNAAGIELAGLEQKDAAERAALAEAETALSAARAAVLERRERREAAVRRLAALGAEIEAEREAVERASAELAKGQERIERGIATGAELRAAVGALEQRIREMRKRDAEEQERLAEVRLAEQRVAMELAALDEEVRRRYDRRAEDLTLPEWDGEEALAAREARAAEIRAKMSGMGDVNLSSLEEHRELAERHAFLSAQEADLDKSLDDLSRAIQKINRTTRERFADTFAKINETFGELFPKLFMGGRAFLKLQDEEDLLETGVEIVAQPPGKKLQSLNLLSGGEKALTAISFLFSIFLVKPSPFCLLDEVDAPLDDANIDRFNALVREMSADYQILLITHNKRTMELADVLYGITMEKPGISKVVSVRFAA